MDESFYAWSRLVRCFFNLGPLCVILLLASSHANAQRDHRGFDGIWEGVITVVAEHRSWEPSFTPETSPQRFRVEISGLNVAIRTAPTGSEDWTVEEWYRLAHTNSENRPVSAIVYLAFEGWWYDPQSATRSRRFDAVVTRVYTVTKSDDDTLLVFGWRVQNVNRPATEMMSKHAVAVSGELRRVD